MSRIEKALEKAASIRNSSVEPTQEQQSVLPISAAKPHITAAYPTTYKAISADNPLLVSVTDPASPISEEYRKLKSMVVNLTKQDGFCNTIMVTSALAGEGKSLTSINLALALAQEYDHTVLLVDADLRRPSIHRYLGIDPPKGLADYLLGDIELSELLINTGIGKLMILPAGRIVNNPVELFTSQKMSSLLAELKNRYPDRYVIVDTPPLLPFAESRHLSHLVDALLFVVKEGLASQASIAEALEALRGKKLLGIVFNEAHIDQFDDRYAHYSNYGSYAEKRV